MQKNIIRSKEIFKKKINQNQYWRQWRKPHKKLKELVLFKSKVYESLRRRRRRCIEKIKLKN
jgi:hypothetical protein